MIYVNLLPFKELMVKLGELKRQINQIQLE